MDCNPDIYAQQNENKDNPHKTKHVDECTKALGGIVVIVMVVSDEIGMAKTFNDHTILMLLEHLIADQEQ
jgi:hypothetical protein